MDTFLKILELFSRNWLIVLVLILVLPIVKIGIQGAINIHIAKISNKNRVVYNIQTGRKVQSLEIHSNNLNLKELSKHMETFAIENKESVLLIEDNKKKEAA
jgi:ABC-type Na+ efflux pump permease subunit